MVVPPYLVAGDMIAICSPAGAVKSELFGPAVSEIERRGYRVKIMSHAMGSYGSYSASVSERLKDMAEALLDPQVKAIICGRGGYGAVHLLHHLAPLIDARAPKWLIGFSDITALHALWQSKGIVSVHASMLKGFSEGQPALTDKLFDILEGREVQYEWPGHALNRRGSAKGELVGGNLAVLAGLIGTPYARALTANSGPILLIEDVNEPIYKIERMLWQLRHAEILPNLSGLIVGEFVGTKADKNYSDVYKMVSDMISDYTYPVALGVPVGHIAANHPLLLGAIQLDVSQAATAIRL